MNRSNPSTATTFPSWLSLYFLVSLLTVSVCSTWSNLPYTQTGPDVDPGNSRDSSGPSARSVHAKEALQASASRVHSAVRAGVPGLQTQSNVPLLLNTDPKFSPQKNVPSNRRQYRTGTYLDKEYTTNIGFDVDQNLLGLPDDPIPRGQVPILESFVPLLEIDGGFYPAAERITHRTAQKPCIVTDLEATLPVRRTTPKQPRSRAASSPGRMVPVRGVDLHQMLADASLLTDLHFPRYHTSPPFFSPVYDAAAYDYLLPYLIRTRRAVENPECPVEAPTSEIFLAHLLVLCQKNFHVRSYDGRCNNLEHPLWGSAMQPYQRAGSHSYEDGVQTPRSFSTVIGKDGIKHPLPNPRVLSLSLSQNILRPHPTANSLMPVFGQLISTDLALTPTVKLAPTQTSGNSRHGGDGIDCCRLNSECGVPECFQFSLPQNDPFYSFYNVTCHQFTRSGSILECATRSDHGSPRQVREQYSQVTHWLDASFLYGSSDSSNRAVRNFYQGQLSFLDVDTGIHNYQKAPIIKQILPSLTDSESGPFACPAGASTAAHSNPGGCFLAGDERVNQQPLTASLHVLFLRFHNALARSVGGMVGEVAGGLLDEEIFQQARKIVTAVWQNVIYREFLPVLLGPQATMNDLYSQAGLELDPLDYGYFQGYDATVNPNVLNEFTAAAFRLHTIVDDSVPRLLFVTGLTEDNPLSTQFNNMTLLYQEGNADAIISGMLEEMALAFDSQMAGELQGKLFRGHHPFGLDLMAIDIQRGRDHGLSMMW